MRRTKNVGRLIRFFMSMLLLGQNVQQLLLQSQTALPPILAAIPRISPYVRCEDANHWATWAKRIGGIALHTRKPTIWPHIQAAMGGCNGLQPHIRIGIMRSALLSIQHVGSILFILGSIFLIALIQWCCGPLDLLAFPSSRASRRAFTIQGSGDDACGTDRFWECWSWLLEGLCEFRLGSHLTKFCCDDRP